MKIDREVVSTGAKNYTALHGSRAVDAAREHE